MADNLDDLFGAFDGDDEIEEEVEVKETKPKKKKAKSDNDDAPVVTKSDEKENTKEHVKVSSIPIPVAAPKKKEEEKEETKEVPKEEEKKEQEDDRAISTGTSHDKSIRSYSAIPDSQSVDALGKEYQANKVDYSDLPPAKTYPFTLDPFQAQAVSYITKNESVLVAAHTSAGKTVVAEYAIAQSLREGQRVIYTSPIKALSNQKYRDLQEEFSDVGLMTGDITINPTATCLVMTTEILRSMLYRGSEVMREVAWVIYDEVHYMRDKERGVVWEESIILLPHKVRFVFLSATIPNARQFVNWIAKIHHQPCHVVYTNYRPTPLQHYVFAAGGEGLHLVVDEKGKFREKNFQKAMAALQGGKDMEEAIANSIGNSGNGKKKRKRSSTGGKGGNTDLHRIVKLVMERNLNPVIIFSFSKKDCEKYALELNREDYTDDVEKDLITQVYHNAIESLGEDDRKLPQVEALLPLLKKGIGIHHGGLLPILKEIVEILFSEGLIKALFATETFAIGINMPAKTVVFTNTRKWDGTDFRWVTSGEYIQMSGRAGRRGKDDRGIVIQMMDEKMEPSVCKGILYGKYTMTDTFHRQDLILTIPPWLGDPDPLNSSYRISYNMLLNMMRVEDVDPEYLLRASFHQYQQESEAPALEIQADGLEAQANEIEVGDGSKDVIDRVDEYYQLNQQLLITENKMLKISRKPQYVVPFLQTAGRLLECVIDGENYGWGVLVSYKKKTGGSGGSAGKMAREAPGPEHTVDVLLPCVDRHFDDEKSSDGAKEEDISNVGLLWRGNSHHCRAVKPNDDDKIISHRVFTLDISDIKDISAVRLQVAKDMHTENARRNAAKSVKEVKRRFQEGVPVLDPVTDMGIKSDDFKKMLERSATIKDRLASHPLMSEHEEKERMKMVLDYGKRLDFLEQAKVIRNEARSCQGMVMRDELKKMKRVLRQLGHVDANGVIQTKGRTACEINTANELVVVELMFCGVFNDLSVEQCVALLSCMTFDEAMKDENPTEGLKSYLANPFYKLQECARTVAKAIIACKIELDEEEFVGKINPGL